MDFSIGHKNFQLIFTRNLLYMLVFHGNELGKKCIKSFFCQKSKSVGALNWKVMEKKLEENIIHGSHH